MLPHLTRDIELAVKTSTEGLDLQAIATLNILAWGGKVEEAKIAKIAGKLKSIIESTAPERQGNIVASKSGALVGFCRVAQDKDEASCWWLERLIVHPDCHRRAIGKAVVSCGVAYAAAREAKAIRSQTHADNHASIRFHENFGFRNDGQFTAIDGDRLVAFSLQLDAAGGKIILQIP